MLRVILLSKFVPIAHKDCQKDIDRKKLIKLKKTKQKMVLRQREYIDCLETSIDMSYIHEDGLKEYFGKMFDNNTEIEKIESMIQFLEKELE